MRRNVLAFPAAVAVFSLLTMAAPSMANPVVYTIDPTQSSLDVEIYDAGNNQISMEQTVGSDTTALAGTLLVDVGASVVTFASSFNIAFVNQMLPQEPDIGGVLPGSNVANYGVSIDSTDYKGPGAFRVLLSDLTGTAPLSGGAFAASSLTFTLFAGRFDINVPAALPIGFDLSGSTDTNSALAGTITVASNVATITTPIDVEYNIPGLPWTMYLGGQIVATAVVPEPSSLATAVLGLLSMALVFRPRLRSARMVKILSRG